MKCHYTTPHPIHEIVCHNWETAHLWPHPVHHHHLKMSTNLTADVTVRCSVNDYCPSMLPYTIHDYSTVQSPSEATSRSADHKILLFFQHAKSTMSHSLLLTSKSLILPCTLHNCEHQNAATYFGGRTQTLAPCHHPRTVSTAELNCCRNLNWSIGATCNCNKIFTRYPTDRMSRPRGW